MKKKTTVLLLEDDPTIAHLIGQILEKEAYVVKKAKNIKLAQKLLEEHPPDIVIADRRLPDGDGLDFCRELKSRHETSGIPIMFLTSKDSTTDKVLGLKMGGDDYLTKPFQVDELLARVEVLLRRFAPEEKTNPILVHGGIELDPEKHTCRCEAKDLALWPKEFELLKIFLSKPGKVISKEFLSQHIWGHDFISRSRAIEMSVRRLKAKLGPKGYFIKTVKGYGYKLALGHNEKAQAK
ncbi:MAG: response regulator transcription factor [Elusimicrobiaceae bacterium]|jgi:DNA-binding response OmpR family regulator